MNVSLQTPNYCFEAKFNLSVTAKMIVDSLPFNSTIRVEKHNLCFKTDIKVPCGQATDLVDIGDVVYSVKNGSICVYFSPVKLEPDNPVITIGKTEIDAVAIGHIRTGDPIHIMSISPSEDSRKTQTPKTDFPENRKLTQSEIDDLVQQLLAQKKKDNH